MSNKVGNHPRRRASTASKPYILTGCAVIGLTAGALGAGGLVPLEGAVLAQGTVRVESHRQTVQAAEAGTVSAIYVRDGDLVEEGDVVVRLDNTRQRARQTALQAELVDMLARQARLIAERDGLDTVSMPEVEIAELETDDMRNALEVQRTLFAAREAAYATERGLETQRRASLQRQIQSLKRQLAAKLRQQRSLTEDLDALRLLLDKGFVQSSRLRDLERAIDEALADAEDYRAQIARAEDGAESAHLSVQRIEQARRTEILQSLSEVDLRLESVRQELVIADSVTDALSVRAPAGGYVVDLQTHTLGAVVAGGERLLDIVPGRQELVVEARIRPVDIDKVQIGQTANIRFSAFDRNDTPTLRGRVAVVSADLLSDETTGITYYTALVRAETDQTALLGDFVLRPGMPAEVFLASSARSAISWILKPLLDGLARAAIES